MLRSRPSPSDGSDLDPRYRRVSVVLALVVVLLVLGVLIWFVARNTATDQSTRPRVIGAAPTPTADGGGTAT